MSEKKENESRSTPDKTIRQGISSPRKTMNDAPVYQPTGKIHSRKEQISDTSTIEGPRAINTPREAPHYENAKRYESAREKSYASPLEKTYGPKAAEPHHKEYLMDESKDVRRPVVMPHESVDRSHRYNTRTIKNTLSEKSSYTKTASASS